MKKGYHIILLVNLVLVILTLFGCSSPGMKAVDSNFMSNIGQNKRASIYECKAAYEGSTGAQLAGVLFSPLLLAPLQAGSTGKMEADGNDLQQMDYASKLQIECFREIEKVLRENSIFSYVNMTELRLPENSLSNEPDYIKKMIVSNNLSIAVKTEFKYLVVPGWNKRIALRVDWTLYESDGKEGASIRTIVASEKGVGVFVNTKNPEHEKTYLDLANKNAQDFISILSGHGPIFGKETINK